MCHPTLHVSLLLVAWSHAAAATESLRRAREDGLERWKRERSTDYLAEIKDVTRRNVVHQVCATEKDADILWMCHKRGSRLAEFLEPYTKLYPNDYTNMEKAYAKSTYGPHKGPLSTSLRVWIENGALKNTRSTRSAVFHGNQDVYVRAMIEKINNGIKHFGTTTKDTNLEMIFLAGDGELQHEHAPSNPTSPFNNTPPAVPINAFCRSRTGAPKHIPLPYQESKLFQAFPAAPPQIPFEQLHDGSVFRGSYFNHMRGHLSILSALGVVPGLDVGVGAVGGFMEKKQCVEYMEKCIKEGIFEATANADATCNKIWGKPMPFGEMQKYKYVFSIDGHAAVLRLPHLLKGPGIVFTITDEWEEYYFPDLVPYVHYVPIAKEGVEMQKNLTTTLAWLQANQDVAKSIAKDSTEWVTKHKTILSDHAYWKTFFALMSQIYQGSKTSKPSTPTKPVVVPVVAVEGAPKDPVVPAVDPPAVKAGHQQSWNVSVEVGVAFLCTLVTLVWCKARAGKMKGSV